MSDMSAESPMHLSSGCHKPTLTFSVLDASMDRSDRQTLFTVSAGLQAPLELSSLLGRRRVGHDQGCSMGLSS